MLVFEVDDSMGAQKLNRNFMTATRVDKAPLKLLGANTDGIHPPISSYKFKPSSHSSGGAGGSAQLGQKFKVDRVP